VDFLARSAELSEDLSRLGRTLHVAGSIIGPDRVSGASPFGNGNDAVVAWALVCQISGRLGEGATLLLRNENGYAAEALVRQIVEVEHLAAWLDAEQRNAAHWIRGSRRYRGPTRNREHVLGVFYSEYAHHCDHGGHPNPNAMLLLREHSAALDLEDLAADLHCHLTRLSGLLHAVADELGYGDRALSR
jgi:hypothetical protein